MAKPTKRTTHERVELEGKTSAETGPKRGAPVTDADVARRAYDIFIARGSDGHAVEDWLQAERDLMEWSNSTI